MWDWLQAEILADTGRSHNEDHAHLLDADIRVMWASSSFEKQGRTVLGQAEQVAFRAGGWQKARVEQQMRDWFAEQAGLHKDDLAAIAKAASAQARAEQNKRLAIEQDLAAQDQQHTRELSDAQRNQALLRDRLATADVRLSVLLADDPASGCNVPTAAGTVGVVHAARRAQLDPAHAQRIIGITDAGDQGLIALRACQGYVKSILTSHWRSY